MAVGGISSLTSKDVLKYATARTVSRMDDATAEVSSGKHADAGLSLGSAVARTLDYRRVAGRLDAFATSNRIVGDRLSAEQSALSSLNDVANGFLETVLSARQGGGGAAALVADAKSRLDQVMSILRTTSGGAYVFSGANSSVPPVDNYESSPPSAGKTAVASAFQSEFGFAADDPAVASLSASQITSYLDGGFAALFDESQWQASFANSGSQTQRVQISTHETIDLAVGADGRGVRALMSALIGVIDTGTAGLNAEAFAALQSRIGERTAQAAADLTADQASVGLAQQRIANANDRIDAQKGVMTRNIASLEDVDIYEASSRLSMLTTQLETSYAVTARLQKLSLLNYL